MIDLSFKSIQNRYASARRKQRWKGNGRIFCISMQRTGTTSVGDFFKAFDYPVATWEYSWKNQWSYSWYRGDFQQIFDSRDFKSFQVFEDDPWWYPEFYKVLYHTFPNSRFVLFTRDSQSWFESMINHSEGRTLGNTKRHCKVYRREKDFYERLKIDPAFQPSDYKIDNLMSMEGMEDHYKSIYETRNREVVDFFNSENPDRLFHASLSDPDKWKNMGGYFNLDVVDSFDIHSHKSS